jgi:O-antigen ligase/cytochrome c-type biogenesis protein CcmH/NrfG
MGRARSSQGRPTAPGSLQSELQRSKLRLFGVGLIGAKVALVPLIFDQSFDLPFSVAKALLSHAIAYALVGVLAGLFIRYGRSFFVWSWLHVPVVAFLAVSAIAAAFAADPVLALYGSHQRMLGLGTIADWVVLYFAIVHLVRGRTSAIVLVTCALGASAVVLGYELMQLSGRDPFRWNIESAERPFSTMGESTGLAQYLASLAMGVFALGLLVDRLNRRTRGALLFYSAVLLTGAIATGTRALLLGIVSGTLALVVFIWVGHSQKRGLLLAVLATVLAAGTLTLALVPSFFGARLAGTIERLQANDDEDLLARLEPSGADRSALFQIGLSMLLERPLVGYGPDNFAAGVPRYRPEGAHPQIQQSLATSEHSWVVHVATGGGILGLTTFGAIVIVAFIMSLRFGSNSAAVAGAAMLASFLGTGLITVNELGTEWLFWSGVGMIAQSTQSPPPPFPVLRRLVGTRGPRSRNTSRASYRLRLAPAVCVAAGILLALTLVGPAAASRSAQSSQNVRLVGRVPQAIELGVAATRSDQSRAAYWDILGLAYVAASSWREASTAFDRAVKLAPYDVRYIGDLARAQLLLGNTGDIAARARAVQLGDQAVVTDPNNPRAHLTRAIVRQATGDVLQALTSVQRALNLDPQSTNDQLYVTATQVMTTAGRITDAIAVARQGVAKLGETRQSVGLRVELARALVAAGQRSEALAELDLALTIWPNEPSAERLRAEIRAGIGR